MNKSDVSYLITILFLAAGFIGLAVVATRDMITLWFGCLAIGVVLFLLRIFRGDD